MFNTGNKHRYSAVQKKEPPVFDFGNHGLFGDTIIEDKEEEKHRSLFGNLKSRKSVPSTSYSEKENVNGRRYTFNFERSNRNNGNSFVSAMGNNFESLEMSSSKDMNWNKGLDFGQAFKFSGGDPDDNRRVYETTYNSIFTYDKPLTVGFDYGVRGRGKAVKSNGIFTDDHPEQNGIEVNRCVQLILCFISALLLILFLPFIGWKYVKRLKPNQRLVVFRLGQKTKTKGPGYAVLLPLVDEGHLVKLKEQVVEIQNISGGTSDGGLVELSWCKIKFKIHDPEAVVCKTKQKPKYLIRTIGETSLLKAISKAELNNLIDKGMGRYEISVEIKKETKGCILCHQ